MGRVACGRQASGATDGLCSASICTSPRGWRTAYAAGADRYNRMFLAVVMVRAHGERWCRRCSSANTTPQTKMLHNMQVKRTTLTISFSECEYDRDRSNSLHYRLSRCRNEKRWWRFHSSLQGITNDSEPYLLGDRSTPRIKKFLTPSEFAFENSLSSGINGPILALAASSGSLDQLRTTALWSADFRSRGRRESPWLGAQEVTARSVF